jgi:hypothetical protein
MSMAEQVGTAIGISIVVIFWIWWPSTGRQ